MGASIDGCCVTADKGFTESYDLMPGRREFKIDQNDYPEAKGFMYDLLDRYQKFEKHFPFYRMDINGFIYRLQETIVDENPHLAGELFKVNQITEKGMSHTFRSLPSWHDLDNPSSDLRQLIYDTCGEEDKLSIHKLKLIALLWCDGNTTDKIDVFYNIIQGVNSNYISCKDDDNNFVPALF